MAKTLKEILTSPVAIEILHRVEEDRLRNVNRMIDKLISKEGSSMWDYWLPFPKPDVIVTTKGK